MNRIVQVRNPKTGNYEPKPIYEVAASHMGRKTFIGVTYKLTHDPNIIGKMTGHVEGSKASYDYVHSQISEHQHKDASLLHASIPYKAKRATWKLSLRNLLDARHYSYTTYNGPDRYVYDCTLLGRTVMLNCTINLVNSK